MLQLNETGRGYRFSQTRGRGIYFDTLRPTAAKCVRGRVFFDRIERANKRRIISTLRRRNSVRIRRERYTPIAIAAIATRDRGARTVDVYVLQYD